MTAPPNRIRLISANLLIIAFVVAATVFAQVSTVRAGHIDPQTFVSELGDQAIRALSSKALNTEQREDEFRKLFLSGFNVRTLGRFAVGRYWRSASKTQQTEYLALFAEFIVRTYAARFGQYSGEKLVVLDSRDGAGRDTIVNSVINSPNGPDIKIDWRVRERKHSLRIVDVVVEGISMAITQRDEFSSVIRRGGGDFENLLIELRAKNSE